MLWYTVYDSIDRTISQYFFNKTATSAKKILPFRPLQPGAPTSLSLIHILATLKKDRKGCLEVLSKVLPALTQPWEPQKSPIYRTLNGGDVTAIAQQLRSRILDDLEHSEEFAFFRGSPEYEQLRLLLEGEG